MFGNNIPWDVDSLLKDHAIWHYLSVWDALDWFNCGGELESQCFFLRDDRCNRCFHYFGRLVVVPLYCIVEIDQSVLVANLVEQVFCSFCEAILHFFPENNLVKDNFTGFLLFWTRNHSSCGCQDMRLLFMSCQSCVLRKDVAIRRFFGKSKDEWSCFGIFCLAVYDGMN